MESDPRLVFDADPERYDRARPRYPAELFDDLAAYAGLVPGSPVLEVGCGPGVATEEMACRGWAVTAVELGPELAAHAADKLAAYPNVEVRNADFERVDLGGEPWEAVMAFTSFHWLAPGTRVARAASLLRSGGALATVNTHQVRDGDGGFAAASHVCYLRWDPAAAPGFVQPRAADLVEDAGEIAASGLFGDLAAHRYPNVVAYTAAEYVDVAGTWSPILAMAPDRRAGLLACLAHLIDERFGGRVRKTYIHELFLARKS